MTPYSIESKYQISVKGYRFLFYTKNMRKNIGKNNSKNLDGNTAINS